MGSMMVARESTQSMWLGYQLGMREMFRITADSLVDYMGVCAMVLRRSRELLEQQP
jgi:hypothetical protein